MRVDVTAEIVIHRPRAAVADYVLDPVNRTQWCAAVTRVRRLHAGGVAPGATYAVTSPGRLRESQRIDEVCALEGLTSMTTRTVSGGAPLETTITLAPEHRNSTLVQLRTTGDPGSLATLTGPLLNRGLRRSAVDDLARLKTILELAREH